MASSGGSASSAASAGSGSTGGNPRKFSEKIALHRQKEAEEKAEFEKMMKELNAVKGQVQSSSQQQQQQQQHLARSMGMSPHSSSSHGSGGGIIRHPHSPNRHLSPPNFSSSVGPRHGSLPNVNAAMGRQLQGGIQGVLSSEDFPLVITSTGSGSGGHVSVRDLIGSTGPIRSNKSRIDTSPYGSERYPAGGGYHLSPPDPSWRRVHSDSSLHQSVGNNGGNNQVLNQNGTVSPLHGASPTTIRRAPNSHHHVQMSGHQQQQQAAMQQHHSNDPQSMDHHLSSYLDLPHDKDSGGGGGGNGSDHNSKPGSLPDLTNFHVNNPAVSNCSQTLDYEEQSSLYSSSPVNTSPGGGVAWSPGTVPSSPRSPDLTLSSNAVSAPINMNSRQQQCTSSAGASPTGSVHHNASSAGASPTGGQQQIFFTNAIVCGSPVLHGDGLSHYAQQYQMSRQQQHQPQQQQHQTSTSPSMSSNVSMHLCSSSAVSETASAQHFTTSSSMTPTTSSSVSYSRGGGYDQPSQKGSSSSAVRLSDDQISEILSIPMALVTEGCCDLVTGNNGDHMATSPNSSVSSSCSKMRFCDTSSSTTTVQNWLHANKGMAIDQSGSVGGTSGHGMYIYNQMSNSNGQTSPTSESPQSISTTYRNPQMIPNAHSPLGYMQGSPSGRSASPNEMLGSPNSPNGPICPSPNHPGVYDSMTGGGGSYGAAQNELSNEFQKFTMVENAGGSSSMFFQDAGGNYNSQPMSDLVNFLGNSHGDLKNNHQGSGNGYHMAPQTPQTPSSIPDIILTDADDASAEQEAYQRAFAMNFDGPNSVVDCLSQEISANFQDLGKLDDSMLRLLSEGVTMDQQIADPMTEEHLKM